MNSSAQPRAIWLHDLRLWQTTADTAFVSAAPEDWRRMGQEGYLLGAEEKNYQALSAEWEHEHCAFCFRTFLDPNYSPGHEEALHSQPEELDAAGYTTSASADRPPGKWWICKRCFTDFHEEFDWTVIHTDPDAWPYAGPEPKPRPTVADFQRPEGRWLIRAEADLPRGGRWLKPFDWLNEQTTALPEIGDPANDLVEAAVQVFRRLVVERTVIYQIGFQTETRDGANPLIRHAADRALQPLTRVLERFVPPDRVRDAVLGLDAICEGLAALELRENIDSDRDPDQIWRTVLSTYLAGLTNSATDDPGRPVPDPSKPSRA